MMLEPEVSHCEPETEGLMPRKRLHCQARTGGVSSVKVVFDVSFQTFNLKCLVVRKAVGASEKELLLPRLSLNLAMM